jgi:hypothetical protein
MKIEVMYVTKDSAFLWRVRGILLTELGMPDRLKCRAVFVDLTFGVDPSEYFEMGKQVDVTTLSIPQS